MVFRYKCVDAIIPWDEFGLTVDRILDGVSEHTFHYGLFMLFLCFHQHSLLTGPVGLELARLADLPSDILQEGRRVAEKLAELQKKQEEESEGSQIALRRKVLLRVSSSQPSTIE
jgi:DNA mismatch repair protein MSH4